MIDGFVGVLQVDGYAVYRKLASGTVTLAFCWAHLRRRFYEIAQGSPAPLAQAALARIGALYAIEARLRGDDAAERRRVRQAEAQPLLAELRIWLERQLGVVSAKSKIAEAIRYGLKHWDGLCRFVDDGRVEIDSNIVERAIHPIALNRKTALFAGSDEGGAH